MSISDVDDIKNNNQQKLQKLHQSTADNEKTKSDNDEQVSCDVELNKWVKNADTDTARSD